MIERKWHQVTAVNLSKMITYNTQCIYIHTDSALMEMTARCSILLWESHRSNNLNSDNYVFFFMKPYLSHLIVNLQFYVFASKYILDRLWYFKEEFVYKLNIRKTFLLSAQTTRYLLILQNKLFPLTKGFRLTWVLDSRLAFGRLHSCCCQTITQNFYSGSSLTIK